MWTLEIRLATKMSDTCLVRPSLRQAYTIANFILCVRKTYGGRFILEYKAIGGGGGGGGRWTA